MIDFAANTAKKLAIVAAILSLLTGVRMGIDRALTELAVAPPAVLSDYVSLFLPSNFGTFLDMWLLFFAVAGAVRLARFISRLNS
ncbi:MAG: hypothetical protein ING71_15720 [Rhodocyclaceae bacterium]|nr:hypothetical protein [Rhodocyclaceae bacterium]MCA3080226.1 hypothetical protein [Rhodocyclaceae bacterium]